MKGKRVIEKKSISKLDQNQNEQVKPKPELSQEAIRERSFLAGLFIERADTIAKEALERKKRKEEELIELRSGIKISISQIQSVITTNRQAYVVVFPNDNPFYKEIYRLNGWSHLNPSDYIKPAIVGKWTVEILYNRLGSDVFPALNILNPTLPNGIRLHKCFQYLTKEGRSKFLQFRDETIELMKKCQSWYEFRQLLHKECGVPYQKRLFESE